MSPAAFVAQVFGELQGPAVLVLNDQAAAAWDGGDTVAAAAFRVCVRRWLRQAVITTSNPRVTVTERSSRVLDVVTAANAGDLLDGLVTP